MSKPLILASASPRRRELLSQLGFRFEVRPTGAEEEEELTIEHPAAYARAAAMVKAEAVAREVEDGIVIGADTVVVVDDHILGKPTDDEDALRMLTLLQGKTHQVITGLAVLEMERGMVLGRAEEHVVTDVHMRPVSEELLRAYIATGEPHDKAGAYGIQGRAAPFIEGVKGDYFNVVGLPLCTLAVMLENVGVSLFSHDDDS